MLLKIEGEEQPRKKMHSKGGKKEVASGRELRHTGGFHHPYESEGGGEPGGSLFLCGGGGDAGRIPLVHA